MDQSTITFHRLGVLSSCRLSENAPSDIRKSVKLIFQNEAMGGPYRWTTQGMKMSFKATIRVTMTRRHKILGIRLNSAQPLSNARTLLGYACTTSTYALLHDYAFLSSPRLVLSDCIVLRNDQFFRLRRNRCKQPCTGITRFQIDPIAKLRASRLVAY